MKSEKKSHDKPQAGRRRLDGLVLRFKLATGITCANCHTCACTGTDGEGCEYGVTWTVCNKRPHISNLKNFPFRTEQNCWEPDFWQSRFAEKIKTGEAEEVQKLCGEFAEAVRVATENTAIGGKERGAGR